MKEIYSIFDYQFENIIDGDLNMKLSNFRIKPIWLALTFCSVVILCIRTILFFPDSENAGRNDLELILDDVTVTDLVLIFTNIFGVTFVPIFFCQKN